MEDKQQIPQLENGYLRIANEIVDKLCSYRLSGEEWMVLLTILRKTYGYQKKEDVISLSQFFKATGLAKPSICRAINKLVEKKVISKKATGNGYSYCFNKIFTTWKPLAKKRPISSIVNDHLQKSDLLLTKKRPQKKYIKENITKENNIYILPKEKKEKSPTPQAELVSYFAEIFEKRFGNKYLARKEEFIMMANLLKAYSPEDLKKYIRRFLYLGKDEFPAKLGFRIGIFYKFINEVISNASPYNN